ncbi:MAG: DUF3087 family protein [Alishewanella agri]|jgi:hypothetical protein|uniref:DUF3087 domain-containing protein n=1 Tax=Alishewanella agri BL06 TaxID=1195246 RepID=I8UCU7_9ALTE|nr:DUF3087 family protein [Alishewanella agri]EIW89783.1 hypothetical protein AGRI_04031 [Alishewanella agri BL06]MDD4864170.1 DUF3087 family protein [Alishewanella agri]
MRLQPVDKQRYRQRLNRITVLSILALLVISLASSTLLISLFATGSGSNFWLNLSGVVIGCLVVGFSLKRLRSRPYFAEVAYIWDLKHELNLIQRKLRAIQAAAEQNDATALLILAFSYAGSRLIWQLDDNTLMMSELNLADNKLQEQISGLGLKLDLDTYRRELLARF